ncbi:MAG: YraN family protein [Rhodocyclaceae bacterium]|nr:YraN family protein [Rhodocyclaceae bacterium]
MDGLLRSLKARIVGSAAGSRQARGAAAEDLAAEHLVAHGARLLARNVRCRGGEVDLIVEHQRCIVFVEVRLRSSRSHGGAAESITRHKQNRVILAARHWLAGPGRGCAARPCRFDAVLLDSLQAEAIEWLQGAFDAE